MKNLIFTLSLLLTSSVYAQAISIIGTCEISMEGDPTKPETSRIFIKSENLKETISFCHAEKVDACTIYNMTTPGTGTHIYTKADTSDRLEVPTSISQAKTGDKILMKTQVVIKLFGEQTAELKVDCTVE